MPEVNNKTQRKPASTNLGDSADGIVHVINGPNLNLLGQRESDIYGSDTLDDIIQRLQDVAGELGIDLQHFQSNGEGELVDYIHNLDAATVDYLLVNAGAYTHTSVALRDALLGCDIPFVEVHISNIFAREEFRQVSYLSDIAAGLVCGFGVYGYSMALAAAHRVISIKTSGD